MPMMIKLQGHIDLSPSWFVFPNCTTSLYYDVDGDDDDSDDYDDDTDHEDEVGNIDEDVITWQLCIWYFM